MKDLTLPRLLAALATMTLTLPAFPALADEAKPDETPLRELMVSTGNVPWASMVGVPTSNSSFLGIYYRHGLDRTVSLRVGYEAGMVSATDLNPPPDVDPSSTTGVRSNRLHVSMVTNGWLYGGAGLTYISAVPPGYGYRYSDSLIAQGIAGLRYTYDSLTVALEYRLGVGGPNSLVAMGGFRF